MTYGIGLCFDVCLGLYNHLKNLDMTAKYKLYVPTHLCTGSSFSDFGDFVSQIYSQCKDHKIERDGNGQPLPTNYQTTRPDLKLIAHNDQEPGFLRISIDLSDQ
jgi:hypothetical protein